MMLFTFAGYEPIGAALESNVPGLKSGRFRMSRYENGEWFVEIPTFKRLLVSCRKEDVSIRFVAHALTGVSRGS
jgi:hypothetical protein